MAVVLQSTNPLLLQNYAELKSSIALWLHRNDLADMVPTFIVLAEGELNRRLRVAEMEDFFAPTALVNGTISIPQAFLEWKSLWVEGSTITPKSSEWIRSRSVSADRPLHYAREGETFIFWPSAGTVQGVYYRRIDGLTVDTETNWLLETAPDLYLYTALKHSAPYLKADARLAMWGQLSESLIAAVNGADKASQLGGGQLVARPR